MRLTFSKYKKALTILIFLTLLSLNSAVFAYGFDDCKSIDEIDSIRAELFYAYDKTSPAYLKIKQKLDKLITKEKLDYSLENRFKDAIRLINNQNYGAASYEVINLIEAEYNLTKCYEMLADISRLSGKYPYKAENYYILALKADSSNITAQYKLAKLYFTNNKNSLALEYLRDIVNTNKNEKLLIDIRNLILNQVVPQNKYDANNLYEILGYVYLKLNLPDEAFNAFEKAIEANDEDIYLKYYLADIYYSQNMLDEALNLYKKIIAQQPSDGQIRLSAAKIYEKKGDLLSAYKQYLQILAYDNDNSNIKYKIYKLHRGYDPETILKRVYLNKRNFVLTSEEFLDFAKILKEKGESKAAEKFISAAKNYESDSKDSIAKLDSSAKQNLNAQNNQKAPLKTYIQKEEPTKIAPKKEPKLKPEIKQEKPQIAQNQPVQNQPLQNEPLKTNAIQNNTQINKAPKLKPEIKQEKPQTPTQTHTQAQIQNKPQTQQQLQNKPQPQTKVDSQPKLKPQITPAQVETPIVQSAKSAQAKRNQEQQTQKQQTQTQPKLQPKLNENPKQQIQQKQPTPSKTQTKTTQNAKQIQKSNEIMGALTPEQEKKILQEISKPLKVDKTSKKYLEFKKVVDKYQSIEPKDKLTYVAIANTYKLMGELYLAIDNYNKALKLEPTDSDIQYNLGLTNMELDKFETAKTHLEKAINLDQDNQKAITLLSFVNQKIITNIINIAYGKFEKEQYVPAFQILDSAIKKYPKNAQLYYYRALVFDKMNRNAAQIIDLQKAIELDPGYYMSYYQLGLAYEKIRNERSALVAYERFLSTEPPEKDLVDEVVKKVTQLSKKYY